MAFEGPFQQPNYYVILWFHDYLKIAVILEASSNHFTHCWTEVWVVNVLGSEQGSSKVWACFPHGAMRRFCFPLAKGACFPEDLLPLFFEGNFNFRGRNEFLLPFIPVHLQSHGMEMYPILSHSHIFWVVNKRWGFRNKFFTRLNFYKTIKCLFHSDSSLAVAQVGQRGCAIPVLGGLSGSNQTRFCTIWSDLRANPAGSRGWTRDLLTPHWACIFLWINYLWPALLIRLSWSLSMKWKRREGK